MLCVSTAPGSLANNTLQFDITHSLAHLRRRHYVHVWIQS